MSRTIRLIYCGLIFLASLMNSSPVGAAPSVPQIFLIQNSGWMLPFYDDPSSKFKELVTELTERVRQNGGSQQVVASFNQTLGDNKSPFLHYKGDNSTKIAMAIKAIRPARKPGRSTYADTDFQEAIVEAIKNYSPGQSCLLWIVTNNKNSPDNSQETVEKNKEFYRFIQEAADIRRIVAFPYPMKVQSSTLANFRANGLMIYVMAYGEQAEQFLLDMLSKNAPFGKQPARLKPLNAEALTFVPKNVTGNDKVKAYIPDGKTLVLSFDSANKPESAQISGQFRNDFFPYDIQSARVTMSSGFQGGKEGITALLSTGNISNIPAGGLSQDINVTISVPPIPSPWSPEVIIGSGYSAQGTLRFALKDQDLAISREFVKSMSEIFPGDPLPDLFVPGESAKSSVTVQPLVIEVAYPIWPTVLIGSLLLLALVLAVLGAVVLRREKIYRVSVDGVQKSYGLRPFTSAVIKNSQGERVGILKRGMGKPTALLDKGNNCTVRLM